MVDFKDNLSSPAFLSGGGEMGAIIRAHDWAATLLGSPENWPQPLKTAVRLILNTGHPMFIWWGPDLLCFYNDAYRRMLGPEQHPESLGKPGRKVWAEIWHLIGDQVDHVVEGRGSIWNENRLVPITRFGRVDEVYWTYSYSPIDDGTAPHGVGGVLVICSETTQMVIAERRQSFRFALDQRLRVLLDPTEIIAASCEALGRHFVVDQVAYAEIEPDGETALIQHEWNGGTMASNARRHRLDDFGPEFIADLKRGETIAIPDVQLDARTSSPQALYAFARASIVSFLNVPLVKAGQLVAVLAVHSATPRAWSPEVVALAAEIAERTWSAAERARAEGSQRNAEERYLALFNAIDQAFCTIEVAFDEQNNPIDYRFLEISPSFERQTGITNGTGRWMREIAPDQDQHWFDTYGRVALTGEPARFENYSTPLGRWWDVYAFRISGQNMIAALFRDITDQKRVAAGLQETEARLRFFGELEERLFSAADATDAMVAATEMLGRKLGASRCAYADVDVDGDRFWIRNDHVAPGLQTSVGIYSLDLFGLRAANGLRDDQTLVVCDVARELDPGEGREMFQAIGIDAIICCPLVKDGRLTAMMAVHQDRSRTWTFDEISLVKEVVERCWAHVERVGAEARLRESEERLRLAVDNADVGFWDVDIINDVLIWPPLTKAMFGISPNIPVTMEDFYHGLHPDDLKSTAAAFLAAADPQRRARYDVEYRTIGREDGLIRWVAAKGRGVFDATGRCLRVAGTAIQITARKEAEEALRELNATLEVRIAQAIAEREEVQAALRQSQKMEAMGQLTGGVAHDFNNLLTPIVGSLDMLQRRGVGGEREQRLIAGAMQSADRAKTLVQRLLAFARRQPLQATAVDVGQLMEGMASLLDSTTGPQVHVSVDVAADLPPAKADPNQLEMALLNLGVNARDAMPDGGTLRIKATRESVRIKRGDLYPGHYVRVSVTDTGIGMDEATLARAIEPFFSTKGIGKGTGLGLSMVHGLAAQLGGAVTIQSRRGAGTTVELWLPVSTEPLQDVEILTEPMQIDGARGLALLVDDEEVVRTSTADMLADFGYEVLEANSAEAALALVSEGVRPNILITDHLMPGMSGVELARTLRSLVPELPVLIVSGYAETDGVAPDLPRLTKPFRSTDLAASLAGLVTGNIAGN